MWEFPKQLNQTENATEMVEILNVLQEIDAQC